MAILQVTAPTVALTRFHTPAPVQVASTPVVTFWYSSANGVTRGTATSVSAVPAGSFVERITRT